MPLTARALTRRCAAARARRRVPAAASFSSVNWAMMLEIYRDEGFTLVELLVVLIIIGVLAAIAIPVYLRQRDKAVESAMRSDLRTVATLMETYDADYAAYPASISQIQAAYGIDYRISAQDAIAVVSASATSYCLTASDPRDPTALYWNSAGGGLLPIGQSCS